MHGRPRSFVVGRPVRRRAEDERGLRRAAREAEEPDQAVVLPDALLQAEDRLAAPLLEAAADEIKQRLVVDRHRRVGDLAPAVEREHAKPLDRPGRDVRPHEPLEQPHGAGRCEEGQALDGDAAGLGGVEEVAMEDRAGAVPDDVQLELRAAVPRGLRREEFGQHGGAAIAPRHRRVLGRGLHLPPERPADPVHQGLDDPVVPRDAAGRGPSCASTICSAVSIAPVSQTKKTG